MNSILVLISTQYLFKCVNVFTFSERIHISTPNKYEYQYVKKPAKMNQFQVAVKTHNDAHFALSASPHDSAEMLEIVLGGRQNTRSWISLGKMGEPLISAATPGLLSWDEFRSFWISWKGGVVQVRRPKSWHFVLQRNNEKLQSIQYSFINKAYNISHSTAHTP